MTQILISVAAGEKKKKNHIIEVCEVSVAAFCLNGDPQSLQLFPKSFQTLCKLRRSVCRFVFIQVLFEQLWDGDTVCFIMKTRFQQLMTLGQILGPENAGKYRPL